MKDDPKGSGGTRRGVLVALSLAGAGLAARRARAADRKPAAPAPGPAATRRKYQFAMVIDLDRCTGCGGCVVACRAENNVAPIGPVKGERTRGIYWMDLLHSAGDARNPSVVSARPVPCMHCEQPSCVSVCPSGATHRTEDGIVAQVWDRCIGCRYCMLACPYSRRHFNWTRPDWEGRAREQLNPDVATRPEGVVEKCTFCQHRIRRVLERARVDETALSDQNFVRLPACAESCPTGAIVFGDLGDPDSEVTRLSKSPRAYRLLGELRNQPKVIYLRETRWGD